MRGVLLQPPTCVESVIVWRGEVDWAAEADSDAVEAVFVAPLIGVRLDARQHPIASAFAVGALGKACDHLIAVEHGHRELRATHIDREGLHWDATAVLGGEDFFGRRGTLCPASSP